MILKSHDLDKWVAKYFVSKMKHIEILEKRKKDTEKCTIQYLFSMSVSFPYHFSIFSVSEFFIGYLYVVYIHFNSINKDFTLTKKKKKEKDLSKEEKTKTKTITALRVKY